MTMPPQQNLASRTAEIGAFKHDPRNPRLHPEENLDAIRKSLARFGQVMPILVSVGTMEVRMNCRYRMDAKPAMALETRTAPFARTEAIIIIAMMKKPMRM